MLRGKTASSMQKTYDECYLICSTAVYFESQNNEAEALRSWRNALDQIYYHNAYRIPASYRPRSETERALQESLRQMELQCKERVDLLEALRDSRKEESTRTGSISNYLSQQAKSGSNSSISLQQTDGSSNSQGLGLDNQGQTNKQAQAQAQAQAHGQSGPSNWLGGGTIPPADYGDIARPPPLPVRHAPKRPSYVSKHSSGTEAPRDVPRSKTSPSQPTLASATLSPPPPPFGFGPGLQTVNSREKTSRTPSPDKRGGMLRTLRSGGKERTSSSKMVATLRPKPPAAAKAATQAWTDSTPRASVGSIEQAMSETNGATTSSTTMSWDPYTRKLVETHAHKERAPSPQPPQVPPHASQSRPAQYPVTVQPPTPSDYFTPSMEQQARHEPLSPNRNPYPDYPSLNPIYPYQASDESDRNDDPAPVSSFQPANQHTTSSNTRLRRQSPPRLPKLEPLPSYRKEYLPAAPSKYTKPPNARPPKTIKDLENDHNHYAPTSPMLASLQAAAAAKSKPKVPPAIPRKAVGIVNATRARQELDAGYFSPNGESTNNGTDADAPKRRRKRPDAPASPLRKSSSKVPTLSSKEAVPELEVAEANPGSSWKAPTTDQDPWDEKVKNVLKNLPKGTDEAAAKQILNEIVIQGDEVHWDDVAGLEIAKSALKETVVYPFLRPDLFMGLREPARGMLLFGPPGTGKTMLARAVATESRSTFFAISASSLTSKYLGESEKLVRALFSIAKALAPSIIFVDEIDSLLSSRGGGSEHEATRRIKTEFLIQWSDLAKAAAGRDPSLASEREKERGDASRVLVLAATNLPWAIDEAARRRFVRRQYIPLPEDWVRKLQLTTLLGAQKHSLSEVELAALVVRTEGFSGSDITALAKDAAMGPLRSLGEKLLHMSPDDIRPIQYQDFEASLDTIRPSVSKAGLKEFEDWAREFGERGG